MSGADFVAVRRISTKANDTLALPGESCVKVPPGALEWLERKGAIRKAAGAVSITPRAPLPPPTSKAATRKKDED